MTVDAFGARFSARFVSAAKRSGMLVLMTLPDGTQIDVSYQEGGEVVLDGVVHVIERSVEYLTASAILRRDMVVSIAGRNFRLKRNPDPVGDGSFSTALLEPTS
ncbi:hypothetical protein ABIC71_000916 [Herbaspirillum seropedicae]|uniref:hypothetical protein n=1 Tax=Herbaspirillum seropedicae TaxID=964 RepID=UPI003393A1CE